MPSPYLVRDGSAPHRHWKKSLARQFAAFADRLGHFVRFAESVTDHAVPVADNDNCAEAEPSATLYHLGTAIHEHDPLFHFRRL